MKFEMMNPAQLDEYIGSPNALIIDLRESRDYVERHIRGAINIPYEKLGGCCMFPMDMDLILYCERGSTSLAAAKELAHKGYRVKTVVGGIYAYRGKMTETY